MQIVLRRRSGSPSSRRVLVRGSLASAGARRPSPRAGVSRRGVGLHATHGHGHAERPSPRRAALERLLEPLPDATERDASRPDATMRERGATPPILELRPQAPDPEATRGAFERWIHKLGERVAFERLQIRLYEALLAKHRALGAYEGGPSRADLQRMLDQERAHLELLHEVLDTWGLPSSVTAVFANALAKSVTGSVSKVLLQSRTSLLDALEAILVAEFADRHGWTALIELGEASGQHVWSERFRAAERDEAAQVRQLWGWIRAASVARDMQRQPTVPFGLVARDVESGTRLQPTG